MKNGLTLLFTILLLSCGQQTKQNSSVDEVDTSRHKIIFLADTSLKTNQNTIKQIIYTTLLECDKYISTDSLIIKISQTTTAEKEITKKMGGVTAMTYDNKHISISIDPNVISWKEILKYTVAHEYNHAYCMKDSFAYTYKWTLLNYLVFEGKADNFAHMLYPKVSAAWTLTLNEKEKLTLWAKIKPKLQLADASFNNEIMFGSSTYPVWGGYTLGFDIVQTALRHKPNLTVKTWTNLDPNKILEMSNYKLGVH